MVRKIPPERVEGHGRTIVPGLWDTKDSHRPDRGWRENNFPTFVGGAGIAGLASGAGMDMGGAGIAGLASGVDCRCSACGFQPYGVSAECVG